MKVQRLDVETMKIEYNISTSALHFHKGNEDIVRTAYITNKKMQKYMIKNIYDNKMLILVNYERKKVYPIDLKTSSTPEWEFEKSFCKWHYYIQSRLYWRNIRANMDADDYFKDFTLEDYRFIVVNPKTLTPLVWEFPLTKTKGDLIDEYDNIIRDPFEIGKELRAYLDCKPPVPNGINQNGVNMINCLHVLEQ